MIFGLGCVFNNVVTVTDDSLRCAFRIIIQDFCLELPKFWNHIVTWPQGRRCLCKGSNLSHNLSLHCVLNNNVAIGNTSLRCCIRNLSQAFFEQTFFVQTSLTWFIGEAECLSICLRVNDTFSSRQFCWTFLNGPYTANKSVCFLVIRNCMV